MGDWHDPKISPLVSAHGPAEAHSIRTHLIRCWDLARLGTNTPPRRGIDPTALGPAIPYAFILQARDTTPAKFRLVGNKLNDLNGSDLRGMPFISLMRTDRRGEFSSMIQAVFQIQAPIMCSLTAQDGPDRPALHADLTILPLLDDDGLPTKAIGTLYLRNLIALSQRKFDAWTLDEKGAENPIVQPYSQKVDKVTVLAESKQTTWHSAPPKQKRAPTLESERRYLKLVRD